MGRKHESINCIGWWPSWVTQNIVFVQIFMQMLIDRKKIKMPVHSAHICILNTQNFEKWNLCDNLIFGWLAWENPKHWLHLDAVTPSPFLIISHVSKKWTTFIFVIILQQWIDFHIVFTFKFRKDLEENGIKTTPLPLNLLPHYLVKHKWLTIHLYIHISEN